MLVKGSHESGVNLQTNSEIGGLALRESVRATSS